jgi:hypothetical protein
MELTTLSLLLIIAQLSSMCPPVAAAAMSRPMSSHLERRLDSVCGGDSSLQQCGAPFPSDFCCPESAVCLQLESTAMAVLCCPAGQDCKFVSPISCDRTAQNATLLPRNQLHSDPTTQLDQCGDSCCPPGATCHSGLCAIQAAATTSSTTSSTTATPTSSVSTTSSLGASATDEIFSQSSPPATASTSPNTLDDIDITDTAERFADEFSGKSFVAGLFPGIVIGAVVVALLMWCLNRRRRQHRNRKYQSDYNEKKHFSAADQLTSLTPDPYRRPTHMRSISEPVSDPANGHRTDFVRGTPSPARTVDLLNLNSTASYTATASGPITPAPTPKIRALFSRSTIFQSPPTPPTNNFPSHLKRGTLTHAYTISPIRALRSKKSSHSLRREMTADAAAAPQPLTTRPRNPPHHRTRPQLPTTNSTGTIKVLMPRIELTGCSPDQRGKQQGRNHHQRLPSDPTSNSQPISSSSWTTLSSSPHFPAPIRSQHSFEQTPTRVPASQARYADRALGTPFSPQQQGGLSVGNNNAREDDTRRQTTFSGFMERAGIRTGGV